MRQSLDCLLGIAPRDAGLGVLSGRVAFDVYPGLKHPTSQSGSTELAEVLRRGWLFGVTYHNMRGAIASATAAWAILSDRSAVNKKTSKLQGAALGAAPEELNLKRRKQGVGLLPGL